MASAATGGGHDAVLFAQRLLSCCGLYQGRLDGIAGAGTRAAERAFAAAVDGLAREHGALDGRSERCLRSLRLDAQAAARRSLVRMRGAGLDARILCGTRSYAEQDALWRQGRHGAPGAIVTRARAGRSWHNFGLAWDIGLFDHGRYLCTAAPYREAAAAGLIEAVEWGGGWAGFPDLPHYQLRQAPGGIAAARAWFEAGGRKP